MLSIPAQPALVPTDPTQAQQHRLWQSLAGGGGGSSADPTHTGTSHLPPELLCHLPHSQEECCHPFPLSPQQHGHLQRSPSGAEGLMPFSLSLHTPHTAAHGRCHLGKRISAIVGVSLYSGRLWYLGILYLEIIYFFLLQFHLLANCYLFDYIYLYFVSPCWWKRIA